MPRVLLWLLGILVSILIIAVVGLLAFRDRNLHRFERQHRAVLRSGYLEKTAELSGRRISYLEGPRSGPPLLLIHGQTGDKFNYAAALPMASRRFHVFAVDCFGHGQSSHDPALYANVAQGQALLSFIEEVVREPVLVSGHSSGGIIAAYLAAEGSPWVTGVLFEDPPFFTLERPRAETTWNWVDLASTAHGFLASGEEDWTMYAVEHARIWSFFGTSKDIFLGQARAYRASHPGRPIVWAWLPPLMTETFRALQDYDPRFGDVFYRGEWEAGWDLHEALSRISVPVTYEKSRAEVGPDGVLRGATSEAEARQAQALIRELRYYEDDKGHSWHYQDPRDFVRRLLELKARAGL